MTCRAVLALALWVAGAVGAGAQERDVPSIPVEGTEVFRYLLERQGFQAFADVRAFPELPARETLLVVFGRTDRVEARFGSVGDYVRDGGNLLFATDYLEQGQLRPFGVQVSGRLVHQPEEGAYRNTPECPLVSDFTPANPGLFVGVKALATNRPSHLVRAPDSALQALARFPPDCSIQLRNFLVKPLVSLPYVAGTAADAGPASRVICVAGHGLFTNGMLLQRDNDNFAFAANCLRYLREGPGGPRKHVLFLYDGTPERSLEGLLRPPPLPPIPMPTVQIVNQLLRGLEDERFFSRLVEDNVDMEVAVRVVVLTLTLVLLVFGAKLVIDHRHVMDTTVPLLTGPFAKPPSALPPVEERHKAQAATNHYGEQAVALARQWFLETCDIAPAAWEGAGRVDPEITATGGWWQRRQLDRQVRRLGQLARHGPDRRVAWTELMQLARTLQDLRAAVRQGKLRVRKMPAG